MDVSKTYGPMVSYDDAIKWVENIEPICSPDMDKQSRVLNRMRYEMDKSKPARPKVLNGSYKSYSCGNCGHGLTEIGYDYCPKCGKAIEWDNPRCLTK